MTDDLIDRYLDFQRSRSFSAMTVKRRRQALIGFERHLHGVGLLDATAEDVEAWLRTKSSPRTRHAYRSDLAGFYSWAVRRHHATTNPVADTGSIRLPKPLPRPIGPEVHVALMTGPLRTRRMVALGMYAGLRCAEIAVLDGSDLWTHRDPPLLMVRDGKGGKDRVVAMHPTLVELFHGAQPAGPLFPGRERGTVAAGTVSALLSRHLHRCGIDATAHQLRHTFGTEMTRAARGNLVAVAAAMGHGSMQTTRGYVGWDGDSAVIIAAMFPDGDEAA